MKKLILLSFLITTSCVEISKKEVAKPKFGLVIHGGAGTILRKNMTLEKEEKYRAVLAEAIQVGHRILKKGAVLNSNASIELDASFMEGKSLGAGAISGVRTVKNPISAAIKVMEASPHVMLSGSGADAFANEQGLEIVSPDYFLTERRINALREVQKASSISKTNHKYQSNDFINQQRYGTVGCVALDIFGNLAAGTSTGGMTNKKWNRIGDAPIIGAGTYANNATCAISSTGWGEFFIRTVVAHDISALMEYKKLSIQDAAYEVIHNKVAKLGGDGGVIGIDSNGNMMMEMNTPGMYRAKMDAQGKMEVKIYIDE
jgi:beta-aspartyl-peptidase (threonine type)